MIHFRQHVPNYVDIGDEPWFEADVETVAEMLELSRVKQWTEPRLKFTGWSLAHRPYSEHNRSIDGKVEGGPHFYEDWLLMANFDDPTSWWVVGYITGLTPEQASELRTWKGPK